jgi:hypothetical protein
MEIPGRLTEMADLTPDTPRPALPRDPELERW